MRVDVYGLQQYHEKWKESVLQEGEATLSKANSDLLVKYILDMEAGRNVSRSSKKGPRSYAQLCNLRTRLTRIMRLLQERGLEDVSQLDDEQITSLFLDMERGVIRTSQGNQYRSVGDYVRVARAFWHWWMKVNRRNGVAINDVMEDLRVTRNQPAFVYLKKCDLDAMLPFFDQKEQLILLFLFDTIMRAPTEILSLHVKDVSEIDGQIWVTVPNEASKTFGRSLNLLYCGAALAQHIKDKGLRADDPLFSFSPRVLNPKLKRVAREIFGERRSHPQCDFYKNITLYDFRHSAAIHFRLLAKENPGQISLDAVRHRAGWTDFSMLNYYTKLIGLDGKIEKPGVLLKEEKDDLEIELGKMREENEALRAEVRQGGVELREMRQQIERVLSMVQEA